jgi:hypothetical protein
VALALTAVANGIFPEVCGVEYKETIMGPAREQQLVDWHTLQESSDATTANNTNWVVPSTQIGPDQKPN